MHTISDLAILWMISKSFRDKMPQNGDNYPALYWHLCQCKHIFGCNLLLEANITRKRGAFV